MTMTSDPSFSKAKPQRRGLGARAREAKQKFLKWVNRTPLPAQRHQAKRGSDGKRAGFTFP